MINLVLIVQRFSPYDKVGARRWSKFVNYLQKNQNIKIHVLTQKYMFSNENPWNVNFDNTVVNIKYLNSFSNKVRTQIPIFNRVINFVHNKIFSYTDEGYGFSKSAIRYLKKNKQRISPDIVIASSPAYSTCFFASKFKKEFPQVKLINDYRDAWIDGYFSWNKTLNQENELYKKQVEMEKFSLNHCDAIVTVTPELSLKLNEKITNDKVKSYVITNGYDKRDYNIDCLVYPKEFDKNEINICHFGTLDFGRDDEFLKFISFNEISDRIKFYLIGSLSEKLRKKIEGMKNVVHINHMPSVSLKPFLYYADFHLIVNDPEKRGIFTKSQCELINGHPLGNGDQDRLQEDVLDVTEQEMKYWEKRGLSPDYMYDFAEEDWKEKLGILETV